MENENNTIAELNRAGLELMRAPFPAHLISKLPKPTKKQTEEVRADPTKGIRCKLCDGWHHPDVIHLDYVGHAALTARLLDCDPNWTWRAVSYGPDGLPLLDKHGGLWIYLTVCGVTRKGYGHSDNKTGGDAIKEAIGDSLRNAAMRFGAALDLWHKGDLHAEIDDDGNKATQAQKKPAVKPGLTKEQAETKAYIDGLLVKYRAAKSVEELANISKAEVEGISKLTEEQQKFIDDKVKIVAKGFENEQGQ